VVSLEKVLAACQAQNAVISDRQLKMIKRVYTPEVIAVVNRAIAAAGGPSGLREIAVRASEVAGSPAYRAAVSANIAAFRVLRGIGGMDVISKHMYPLSGTAGEVVKRIMAANRTAAPGVSEIVGRVCGVAELTALSRNVLSSFDWQSLGQAINMGDLARRVLERRFVGLSGSYSRFYSTLEQASADANVLGGDLWELPAQGYFCGVDAVCAVSIGELERDADDLLDSARDRISRETETVIGIGLRTLDPNLLAMWLGARDACGSRNMDRGRQACVSLRELLTHVIHMCAPDAEVREFVGEQEGGQRLTRQARLRYICRHLDQEAFRGYVAKEITFVLTLMEELNSATHRKVARYSDHQLSRLRASAGSAIRLILLASAVGD